MDDAAEILDRSSLELLAYRAALRRRFGNAALSYALTQIAADGSQKLPPRLLATMADGAAAMLASPGLAKMRAGWILALARIDGLTHLLLDRPRPWAQEGTPAATLPVQVAPDISSSDYIERCLTVPRGR